MSELEAETAVQKVTEPLGNPENLPWRSLLWFTLLLGTGCLLHGPLQNFRDIIAMRYLGRVNRWIDFLSEFPAAICVMGLLVHVTLASLCLTWSVGKLWRRTLVFVVSLLLAGALLFAGYLVSPVVANLFFNTISRTYWIFYFLNDQTSLPVLAEMASALPLLLLGIQLPFWIARAAGWRLVRQDGLQHPAIRESLSIGHLMIATGVVGACFALLQIGRHFLKENAEDPRGFLAIVLATALASAIVVTCIAWPLAWAFLKPVRWSVAWLISLAISTSLVVLLSFAFQILTQGRLHWMIVVGIATMIFSYVGGVSTGLALLRIDGWQLAPRGNSLAK